MKKYLILFFTFIFLFLIGCEVFLRIKYGFCDAPLAISSKKYEYIFAPNQHCYRFGNHVNYNCYSQRSLEPDTSKTIVLGLGDSVINGGVQTDQNDLATSIVSKETSYQVLNVSCGSWGPDNCAAYLKEKGLFHAKMMLLVVGSGDAFDNMDFQPVVGKHVSYPDKQYKSAIFELFCRYIIPRIFNHPERVLDPDQKALLGVNIHKNGTTFNPGFSQLKTISDSVKIPLIIYLHPDMAEMKKGYFNEQGNMIIKWAKDNRIPLYSGFEEGENIQTYRDGIHINKLGQKILATWMKKIIPEYLHKNV